MSGRSKRSLNIRRTIADLSISDIGNNAWRKADLVAVDHYWSGAVAPEGRRFTARLLWSDTALYIRFEAAQGEPLVISDKPDRSKKVMGLWDRDVCEIFVAPDASEPRKYFEFEVAPTGEWLDVALDLTSGTRKSDWGYSSGMGSFARVESDKVVMAMKIPWKAFGKTPKAGDIWLGNILRCVGKDPGRGYLAWQPTMTPKPAFHVPEKFGEFKFVS
jgi:hypothetical protein